MMLSHIRDQRAQRARMAEAAAELSSLHAALTDAYGAFDRSADPALLESAILEIGALRARYGCLLREVKALSAAQERSLRKCCF